MPTAHRTYQERAYLTRGKHRRLDEALRECARLYNAALEEWKTAYRQAGVGRTYHDQCRELTAIRAEDEYWGRVSVQVGRGALMRLDRARKAFFRRVESGEKPGYPKFKPGRRWKSIEIAEPTSAMITDRRGRWCVKVRGLPTLPLRVRRELPPPACLKGLTITRKPTGVYVSLTYAVEIEERDDVPEKAVGLDMGVNARITASDGWSVERRPSDTGRVAALQRRIARCRRGSNNRRKLVRQPADSGRSARYLPDVFGLRTQGPGVAVGQDIPLCEVRSEDERRPKRGGDHPEIGSWREGLPRRRETAEP